MEIDKLKIEYLTRTLLGVIGEDIHREGLKETPERVARFWEEFINYDPGKIDVMFESAKTDQMVVLTGIRVYSLCEHHLLPFSCDVSIGYITGTEVVGLSKLARIAYKHAHRLQVQERLTAEIANSVMGISGVMDVAVITSGVHMCMQMRGIKSTGVMVVSEMRGKFRNPENPGPRDEFFRLCALAQGG